MADDYSDKTEPPTPRRRSEARNRGQVAKSQDLPAAVLSLGGLLALLLLGSRIWESLLRVMRLSFSSEHSASDHDLPLLASAAAVELFKSVGPLLAILFVLALLVMYAQVGLLLTLKPLTPSLSKINPLSGLKRLLSARTAVQSLIGIGKLGMVAAVAYLTIIDCMDKVIYSAALDFDTIFPLACDLIFTLALYLALILLIMAIIDFAYQRYRHEKDLRMTKEEVKEELRSMEGDPVMKRRRREVQMQLTMQRLRKDVPEADVVVTNPTHYAVALKYDPDAMNAPKVIAKGADYLALRIRELAAAASIPIVERPPLARAMYEEVEVGREIPGKFFQAVAEILAYVYELTGKNMKPRPIPV